MSIIFQRFSYQNFVIYDEIPNRPMKKQKAWESKYDPKHTKGTSAPKVCHVPPPLSSFPQNRCVVPRDPQEDETISSLNREIRDWLENHELNYQQLEVVRYGRVVWAYYFKKAKDAMLFKLTWC